MQLLPDNFLDQCHQTRKTALKDHRMNAKDPPMEKDNLLMQPLENWEKSDLRAPGQKLFFHVASHAYRRNYDLIDWSK